MFQKILVLVVVLAAVWYGFKLIGRLDQARRERLAQQKSPGTKPVADTVECKTCGAYIPVASLSNCGKAGCPH